MKILVMGGDERMIFAARALGADALYLGENVNISGKYEAIVLPVPLSKDGENVACPIENTKFPLEKITEFAKENAFIFAGGNCPKLDGICREKGYRLENYFDSETLTLKNARLTAEAAVMLMIQASKGALLGEKALITGYGRIAKFLAKNLAALGCMVTISARKPEARAAAALDGYEAIDINNFRGDIGKFGYIANTVPAQLFNEEDFKGAGAVFIELATLPQEPTKTFCEANGLKYIFAGGLPGKYSPKAAGEYIADEIKSRIMLL